MIHTAAPSAPLRAIPSTQDEREALWVLALDRASFATCHALIRAGFAARTTLAAYRDLTPAGRTAYARLAHGA